MHALPGVHPELVRQMEGRVADKPRKPFERPAPLGTLRQHAPDTLDGDARPRVRRPVRVARVQVRGERPERGRPQVAKATLTISLAKRCLGQDSTGIASVFAITPFKQFLRTRTHETARI